MDVSGGSGGCMLAGVGGRQSTSRGCSFPGKIDRLPFIINYSLHADGKKYFYISQKAKTEYVIMPRWLVRLPANRHPFLTSPAPSSPNHRTAAGLPIHLGGSIYGNY